MTWRWIYDPNEGYKSVQDTGSDLPVSHKRIEAYREQEDDTSRRQGYMIADDYDDAEDTCPSFSYYEPPPSYSQGYSQSNRGYQQYSYPNRYNQGFNHQGEFQQSQQRSSWNYLQNQVGLDDDTYGAAYGYQQNQQSNSSRGYHTEQRWDCNGYEPEMTPSSCYREEYNDYNYQYSQPIYQDPYKCNQVDNYQCDNRQSSSSQWAEFRAMLQRMEESSARRVENTWRILAENEKIISRLRGQSKTKTLDEVSPVEEFFQEAVLSKCGEEVVENNTTPIPSIVEDHDGETTMAELTTEKHVPSTIENEVSSIVDKTLDVPVVDEGVEEELVDLPEHEVEGLESIDDTTPLEEPTNKVTEVSPKCPHIMIPAMDKVREDGLGSKKRKISKEDIETITKKRACIYQRNMQIMKRRVWTQPVNYRAYLGNSVGKCEFKLSKIDSTDRMIIRKHVLTRHMRYRAFVGNVIGKCSLRPP